MPRAKKKKQTSLHRRKKYVREKYFNRFIRLRDADDSGYCTCVTCGKRVHWQEANAGHFIHGLDFIEDNQHSQCVECNLWNSGRLRRFTLWMIDKFGRERVDELMRLRDTLKYSRAEIQEISDKYRGLIAETKRPKENDEEGMFHDVSTRGFTTDGILSEETDDDCSDCFDSVDGDECIDV